MQHAQTITLHEALYVVALMWVYSLNVYMTGPWKHQYISVVYIVRRFVDVSALVVIYSTGITVWYVVVKGLITFMTGKHFSSA